MSVVRFHRLACAARLWIADDFIHGDAIDAILATAGDGSAFGGRRDETGESCELPLAASPAAQAVARRIAVAVGVGNAHGETLRFRRYRPGDWHPPHLDAYDWGDGSRLEATAMLCLVAPQAGGETRFPAAEPEVRLSPRAGRLAVWLNYRDGRPDPRALHEALAVQAGEKTTLTAFIYATGPVEPAFAEGLDPVADVAGVRIGA